ncbi:class I SAM-dependent methyltransferase [Actinomadura harenae]|uniref:Class I SAM-dependent methyltransferase n=1 Tax=Actinomadura harenae TaxID=2483351 RepID=A0A3M2LGK5_9ACTN|nr:class I SAM-dependent methyltransferase [Actinomadura harenae]RMI36612.1 class I SAM-dependent methyltransferase [Actinomadura harenae]
MSPHDAVAGWDEDATAEAYNAFCRTYPMYASTSRDLASRAQLAEAGLVVDLCGGVGTTASAILDLVPARTRVVSIDNAAAMQRVGRRTLTDTRLTWIACLAERLVDHLPAGGVDAVVCNSAIWKTDASAVFAGVARTLRPGGRFVFNIGGGFAGVRHPDEQAVRLQPSLSALVRHVATRDHGYAPDPTTSLPPKLPLERITTLLAAAGLTVAETEVTAQHSTMAEKKAWLSIPVFAQPDGDFSHAERMRILQSAYTLTTPETPTVTSWLVVVAQLPQAIT